MAKVKNVKSVAQAIVVWTLATITAKLRENPLDAGLQQIAKLVQAGVKVPTTGSYLPTAQALEKARAELGMTRVVVKDLAHKAIELGYLSPTTGNLIPACYAELVKQCAPPIDKTYKYRKVPGSSNTFDFIG